MLLTALPGPGFVLAETPVLHEKADPSVNYYNQPSKEGWYWYHDPAPTPEAQDKEHDQKQPPTGNYTRQQLYDMYPDQFQELLKIRLKTAVQYPTRENVLNYLTMQDIARRKAAAFSSAVQLVTQENASTFSVNDAYPRTIPGREAMVQMQQKEIAQTIAAAKNDHAILFFGDLVAASVKNRSAS